MNAMHTRNRVFSLLALLLALCLAFPAFAEEGGLEGVELEEVSIEDLAPQEETLVSNPLPIDFTGGFLPLPGQLLLRGLRLLVPLCVLVVAVNPFQLVL